MDVNSWKQEGGVLRLAKILKKTDRIPLGFPEMMGGFLQWDCS